MMVMELLARRPLHCRNTYGAAYAHGWPTAGSCRQLRSLHRAAGATTPQSVVATPDGPEHAGSHKPHHFEATPRQHQQSRGGNGEQVQHKPQRAQERVRQLRQQRGQQQVANTKQEASGSRAALSQRIERLKRQNMALKQAVDVFLEQPLGAAWQAEVPAPHAASTSQVPDGDRRIRTHSSTDKNVQDSAPDSNEGRDETSSDHRRLQAADDTGQPEPIQQHQSTISNDSPAATASSSTELLEMCQQGLSDASVLQAANSTSSEAADAAARSAAVSSTTTPAAPVPAEHAAASPSAHIPSATPSVEQPPQHQQPSQHRQQQQPWQPPPRPVPQQQQARQGQLQQQQALQQRHQQQEQQPQHPRQGGQQRQQEEGQPPAPAAPRAPAPVTATAAARMSIVFAAAEVDPWSKTGGLGDVMGALPVALAARGHRVMVVAPRYANSDSYGRYVRARPVGGATTLRIGNAAHVVRYHHQATSGVDWVFVDHVSYHRSGTPYCDDAGRPFPDNLFRFQLLTLAALEAPLALSLPLQSSSWGTRAASSGPGSSSGSGTNSISISSSGPNSTPYTIGTTMHTGTGSTSTTPSPSSQGNGASTMQRAASDEARTYGEDVMFIANDWHTALLPLLLAARKHRGVYSSAHCALAIHNLAHQGSYDSSAFHELGLSGRWFGHLEWVSPDDKHKRKTINLLKAGITAADALITVSQSYAREIVETPQQHRADVLLAEHASRLRGIPNGVDMAEWDPSADPHLPARYGEANVKRGKAICKHALLRELRLPQAAEGTGAPLVAFIGRLDAQKGPDLMLQALPFLANMDCQVVMLGSGSAAYEEAIAAAQQEFGWCFRAHIGFNVALSHRIMAAADILMMPSRFEPCGLNQLYSLRYGTIPVAHATGGLIDTIDDWDPFCTDEEGSGTGWTFAPATVEALVDAVSTAVQVYREQPARWRAMQLRGMRTDVGWARAAAQYEQVLAEAHAPAHVVAEAHVA